MPLFPGENLDDVFVLPRRVCSRRHITKVMYMDVMARPIPAEGFDAKILMKHVSRSEVSKKLHTSKSFPPTIMSTSC